MILFDINKFKRKWNKDMNILIAKIFWIIYKILIFW